MLRLALNKEVKLSSLGVTSALIATSRNRRCRAVSRNTCSANCEPGRLGQPIQLHRKLVVLFKPCAEVSDGDVVLAGIVHLHCVEVLRVGV